MKIDERHRGWIDGYCSGTLVNSEFAELEDALRDSPELRKLLVEYRGIETALRALEPISTGLESVEISVGIRSKLGIYAMAAGLVIGLGLGIWAWSQSTKPNDRTPEYTEESEVDEPMDDGVGRILQILDVEWSTPDAEVAGGVVSPCALKFESGLIEVEFFSGAKLIVEGPADVDLVSADRVVCHRGKLRGFAPPHARGFTILSPSVELVDLGTEFGMEVSEVGHAQVHVFEGEVELYRPDGKRESDGLKKLKAGDALEVDSAGSRKQIVNDTAAFPTFDRVRDAAESASQRRLAAWKRWSLELAADSDLVAHYDFESDGRRLFANSGAGSSLDGTVVGCESAAGRWPQKRALDFKRLGDRVRIDVPGELRDLTLAAWIRVDALPQRRQALLMSDGYEEGQIHWQISPAGELRFGSRLAGDSRPISAGLSSPVVFGPREIGVWNFVAVVRSGSQVVHYFNGLEVSSGEIATDQPLEIGAAEIGNWGNPLNRKRSAVRNFVGRMDDLILWGRALESDDIFKIYRRTHP